MIFEERLIKDCLRGKASAQELLYKHFAARMLGVCMRYCSSKYEAEDIMQDGFVKVFTKLGNYKKQKTGSLGGWICRIMVNTAINHYRDNLKHRFHSDVDNLEETFDFGDDNVEDQIEIDEKVLMEIIQQLPQGYKMVFNLYVFENLSHSEISMSLGISESTSKSQLFKARATIRKKVMQTMKISDIKNVI